MVPTAGIEPAPFSSSGRRSYRLSYVGSCQQLVDADARRRFRENHGLRAAPAVGKEAIPQADSRQKTANSCGRRTPRHETAEIGCNPAVDLRRSIQQTAWMS